MDVGDKARARSFEFARTVCHGFLTGGLNIEALRRAAHGISWRDLREFVYIHDLEPICHRVVGGHPTGTALVPADLLGHWEEAYYRNVIFNTDMFELVGRIADGARERNIELVVWKGPVAIADVYRESGLRIAVDVDVLCRRAQIAALSGLLFDLGCRPKGEVGPYSIEFRAPDLDLEVDLHFDLYDTIQDRRGFLESAFEELEWLQVEGVRVPAFSPEAHLTLVFGHLAHHELRVNLRQLLDFAGALVRGSRPPTWGTLDASLRRTGLDAEFRTLASVVATLFDLGPTGVPTFPASRSRELARATSALYHNLLSFERFRPEGLTPGTRLRTRYRDKARYLVRRLFPPPSCLAAVHNSRRPLVGLFHLPGHVCRALVGPLRGPRP